MRFGDPVSQLLGLGGPAGAYRVAFVVIGVITVGSVVEAARLSRTAGENIRPVRAETAA